MQTAQNSSLRNCLGVHKWTPIDNIHSEFDILPVTSRTEISHVKFVNKVLKNIHHPLHIYIALEFAKECNVPTALIISLLIENNSQKAVYKSYYYYYYYYYHGLQISNLSHRHSHAQRLHRSYPKHSYHRVTPHDHPRDTLGASAYRNSRK